MIPSGGVVSIKISVLTGSTGFVSLAGASPTRTLVSAGESDNLNSLTSVVKLLIWEVSVGRPGRYSSIELCLSE